jgi:tetratricopeptide (TPR) repeat protein
LGALPGLGGLNMKLFITKAAIIVIIISLFVTSGCKKKSVDFLLRKGNALKAQELCESLQGEERIKGLKKIAVYYFRESDFKKAATIYKKAGMHESVISSFLLAHKPDQAESYCNTLQDNAKKQCANQLAGSFFRSGNYNKAIKYYQMAEKTDKANYVKSKVPAFQLIEKTNSLQSKMTDNLIKDQIQLIQESINAYIYMDSYLKWRNDKTAQTDISAAEMSTKATEIMNIKVAPTLITALEQTISNNSWTQKDMALLLFHQARLDSLINCIKGLDKIAGYRKYFTRYSVAFTGKPLKDVKKEEMPGKDYNYEEIYRMALKQTNGLFETLKEDASEVGADSFADYQNDLEVDAQIIGYIAGILDNLKTRINEIDLLKRKIGKLSSAKSVQIQGEKYFWDFVFVCNQVLYTICKEDYQEANNLLLMGYNDAKSKFATLTETLKAQLEG